MLRDIPILTNNSVVIVSAVRLVTIIQLGSNVDEDLTCKEYYPSLDRKRCVRIQS